jgi:hypothetical protein
MDRSGHQRTFFVRIPLDGFSEWSDAAKCGSGVRRLQTSYSEPQNAKRTIPVVQGIWCIGVPYFPDINNACVATAPGPSQRSEVRTGALKTSKK